LGGYNSNRFDIPMLIEEFLRAGIEFSIEGIKLVDVQKVFHMMEQRTLSAAYKFYCSKVLEGAHGAEADVIGTYEVLCAQIEKYKDVAFTDKQGNQSMPIVNDMDLLAKFTTSKDWVDFAGRMVYDKDGKEVFNFGKHKGRRVEEVFAKEPSYYDWMMNGDFALSTKRALEKIKMRGLLNKFKG
jgi:DNA polymerase-3 subunit epsilon